MNRIIRRNKALDGNTDELCKYLSKMAARGYILDRMLFEYLIFKKGKPRDTKYYIDYYKPNDSNDMECYCFLHKSHGLKIILSKSNMNIFEGIDENAYLEKSNEGVILTDSMINKYFNILSWLFIVNLGIYLDLFEQARRQTYTEKKELIYIGVFLFIIILFYTIKAEDYSRSIKGNKRKVFFTYTDISVLFIILPFIFLLGSIF